MIITADRDRLVRAAKDARRAAERMRWVDVGRLRAAASIAARAHGAAAATVPTRAARTAVPADQREPMPEASVRVVLRGLKVIVRES